MSGATPNISNINIGQLQVLLKCGSVAVPLGEKARTLEKDKASGASEGLEPLSTGATKGSTGAATCSTAAALGPTGTSRGSNAAVSDSTGPILL